VDREDVGIKVLGPLAVDGSGRLGPRDRVVLQALAVRQGRSVTSDELADAVWGDGPPPSAHKNIQSCIVRLRKALGPGAIETTDQGYRLALPADEVDARRFEAQVARARHLLAVGEADRVVFQLENALELWEGSAFADLGDWGPARREAGRLDEVRLDAEELLLDAQLRCGQGGEVLARAHEMVRAAPLRERRWELLALAQYRSGAQGEALRTIRQLRAVLARELGIDPSPDVAALEEAILRQDPTLLVPEARRATTRCPWQGLRAYDIDDAERFFGRDADVAACLAVLARGGFLAVVGPSGSGKSSLLRAGVLAALHQRGHDAVLITPGTRPLEALSALAPDAPARTVLAVDQAEELWTLCDDLDDRQAFLERLTVETGRRPVLVAIRGDRLTQATEHAGFSQRVELGLHLVGALGDEGLRDAVERPAQQAGLVLEPGLVELLVREVRDDPGALPLLSHALLETWHRREGSTLTVDGYRASGGIHGAVAQSAEALYAQLDADQRRRLRDLVLRLVSPGADGEAVRTRVARRLVAADDDHDRLIESLVAARLVTSDEDVLEITHEALARAWPRLRGWLEDDVEGQRIRHHLSGAADAWDGLGRPDSELYRGVRLTRALDWAATTSTVLTETERDFLEVSRVQAEVEEQTAAERARSQARLIRRLRIVLSGAVVLLALALVAGGFAAVQSNRANENAARAQQAAVSADARRVGLRSQLTDDVSLSLLLAAAGARLEDAPETRANMRTAMSQNPRLIRSGPPGGGYLEGLTVSPDGRWVASSDDQGRMHLYDAATNRLVRSHEADPPPEGQPALMIGAFSPDSTQLAVVFEASKSTQPVRLLDPETMRPTTTLDIPGDRPVWGIDVGFSADGRHLAATMHTSAWPAAQASGQTYALVWDLQSPSTPPVRVPTGTPFTGVALSPDGRILYTSEPLTAYEVATGEQIWRREHVSSGYGAFDINIDGTLLALADFDGPVGTDKLGLLVDVEDGSTIVTLNGHKSGIWDIRFSPDGSLVGSVSADSELIVWDPGTARPVARWDVMDQYGVGFSPDNDRVYTGYGNSMLRAWDLSLEDTYLRQTARLGDAPAFRQADISPDGRQVAYGWIDARARGWVRFVDLVTRQATPPRRFPVWDDLRLWSSGVWRPDGRRYAGYWCTDHRPCATPGTVTVLDPRSGQPVNEPADVVEGDGDIWAMAYVDHGRTLLVVDSETEGFVIDADTLRPLGEAYDIFDFCACSATPLRDGSTAMAWEWAGGGTSTLWRVLDVISGEVLSEGDALELLVHASVASPDGSTVAVAGDTGEIVTLDVPTGHEERRSSSVGAPVYWLDYSDDGELLVSGAEDGGVSLWDATTLDLLGTVHPPHRGAPVPASAGFIGDSHDVAIASFDGRVYRWETDLDRAIDFACQMAGRDLTEEEWEQFLPAQPYRSVCHHGR
jgi:WD40 repeat protein/DNA-binding SARP family transcriptional activator/energy-coupling factor transporter ATP-binding protein EcfA2